MALTFDIAPYYDDFETAGGARDNNYMRILFRPGYAVQARELTQLQSIIQNQIKAFGNHIFQDGSPVFGGHVSVDKSVVAIQLNQQYANVDISLTDFLVNGNNTLIINSSGATTVQAIVIAIDDTQANPVILCKYLTGNRFNAGDVLQVATGVQTPAQIASSNAFSSATVASINSGIFYSGGFFVQVNPQTIVLDSTTTSPTYRIGLQIQENIIDEVTDTNLLDPAQGSFNYQAPGATRYQYVLALAKRTLTSIDDSKFYELLRIENGLITKQVDYPIYADLDKTLARRTFDQAGNFTVRPFIITMKDNPANANQFFVVAEPGKAYIKGFEFETIGTQKLTGNKALSTNTVKDYGMSMEFGNILTVANVNGGNTGFFDVANFQSLDIHIVPTANINTAASSGYNATKIGTARVRDIEFLGLGQYYAYVTDVTSIQNTFVAVTGSSNTLTFPANYSTYTNAYANVLVVVNTGGIVDTRTILSYNQGTAVATLSANLSTPATSTSNCTLLYGIKDAESLAVTPAAFTSANVYYAQNTKTALYPAMDISISGKDYGGNTVITDTQFNKLIFPLPQSYVAQGTITNASFYHRKNLSSQSFSFSGAYANLAITSGSGLGSGESFPYGFTNGFLPDNTANANFVIIVRDKASSNLSNGQIVNFNRGTVAAGNGIFETDSTHATLVVSSNAAFVGDVLFTVKVTNATSAAVARRTKTIVGNNAVTALRPTDSNTLATLVIGSPNNSVYVDTSNGFVWFTKNPDIPKTPGSNLSLYVPDVFNVIKVYDSGNTAQTPNPTNSIDVTDRYYFNSGQKDNYYDHASLVLKSGVNPPTGQTVAMIQYFSHDAVLGFFDADSYQSNTYANNQIPYYNSPYYGVFSLRDSIDFRPTRTIGTVSNVQSLVLNGLSLPQPDNAFLLNFDFYLPRIDKLQLTKEKVFRIKQGVPAQNPQAPADSDDAMTLYVLSVPAFTANVQEIKSTYIENKRYTMRDIGALDKRIQQLEYYSALSQLEAQATNEKILYQDNVTNKDQYGIIADDFGSFSIADTQSPDLICSLQQGALTPYQFVKAMSLQYANTSSGSFTQDSKVYSLNYTEATAVSQNSATSYISVQPFLFAQFKGSIQLTPETDHFFSTTLAPVAASQTPPSPQPNPPAANTLPVTTAQTTPVVVSTQTPTTSTRPYWYFVSNINPKAYIKVPVNYVGYGWMNLYGGWYGWNGGRGLNGYNGYGYSLVNSTPQTSLPASLSGAVQIPVSGLAFTRYG